MTRISLIIGLILCIMGLATSPFNDMWGFALVMIGLAVVGFNVAVDWSSKHGKSKVIVWLCIALGIIGLTSVFVITSQPITELRILLVVVSVIFIGLGIFVGPYLIILARFENKKE